MIASIKTRKPKKLIIARYERRFLIELMKIWRDPETGHVGMTQRRLSDLTGIALRSITYFLQAPKEGEKEHYPDAISLRRLGKFFGLLFVEDWRDPDKQIDLKELLETLRAFNSLN